jgi:hypothetical protein
MTDEKCNQAIEGAGDYPNMSEGGNRGEEDPGQNDNTIRR